MRLTWGGRWFGWVLGLLLVVPGAGGVEHAVAGPRAAVAQSTVAMDTVVEGQSVRHQFVFENAGDRPLEILDVKADCGCTTVDYDRTVAPRAEGRLTAVVDTSGYGGQTLQRNITVRTNDPARPNLTLTLQFAVDRLFTLEPTIVRLEGEAGRTIQGTVRIRPEPKYPFRILEVSAKKGDYIDLRLDTEATDQGETYLLTVTTDRREKGRFFDKVLLRTDSPHRPEISVGVFGRII